MAADQAVPPNQSLYIKNLPEKFQKDDLRRALYMLFSPYGAVIDVTAMKTSKMRGQAHVLFKDIQSANQAMRACQGLEFFGRQMVRSSSRQQARTVIDRMCSASHTLRTAPTHSPNSPAHTVSHESSTKKRRSRSQARQQASQHRLERAVRQADYQVLPVVYRPLLVCLRRSTAWHHPPRKRRLQRARRVSRGREMIVMRRWTRMTTRARWR